jgi:hypothetical protein
MRNLLIYLATPLLYVNSIFIRKCFFRKFTDSSYLLVGARGFGDGFSTTPEMVFGDGGSSTRLHEAEGRLA